MGWLTRLLLLVGLLAAAPAGAQPRQPATPAAALAGAQALAAEGRAEPALRLIEGFLAGPGRTAAEPDAAILRLEAARLAADAAPDRAAGHLAAAERLLPAFAPAPLLGARLRRELARVAERTGDLARAERLLAAAAPALLAQGDAAAAAEAHNALGAVRLELLRPGPAAADFRRSLDLLARAGATSGEAATAALVNLANAHVEMGDLDGARAAAARARTAAGSDARLLRAAVYAEAQVLLRAPDLPSAEALLVGLAAASEDDPVRGHALLLLATSRFDRGRMPEAAEAALAALDAYRPVIGERHPAFARTLHTLGTIHVELGDPRAAEGFFARAADLHRAAFGGGGTQFHATELERAALDIREKRAEAAERRANAALAAFRARPPPDRRLEALATVVLGLVAEERGRLPEAARLYRRAQSILEAARGPFTPDLGFSLVRLGRLLTRSGQFDAAAAPIDRAIAIYERVGSAGTVRLAEALTARAELRARLGRRHGALEDSRRALVLLRERIGTTEGGAGEAQRRGARELFVAQARLLLALADGDAALLEDAFAAAQEAVVSRAGEALRRSAARLAVGEGELSRLVRRREAAAEMVLQIDAVMLAVARRTGSDAATEALRLRAAREEARLELRVADQELAARFPTRAAFMAPQPVTLAAVQAALEPDEALVAPVLSQDGVVLWAVRRHAAQGFVLPLTASDVSGLVQRLRAGVDLGLLNAGGTLVPFDVEAAQALEATLLGPARAAGLLEGVDHLVLVPDGALQQIPPHLLLDDQRRWLAQRFAVTIAPSVGAAVAAREAADQPSDAPMSFLGIGDPTFSAFNLPASPGRRGPPEGLRQRLATLDPLPETAEEVRRIADLLGVERSRLLLGDDATERGVLDAEPHRFRVISFSTHALMAGELPGLTEPAIVLTPSGDDAPLEGLLTASDIAVLELDADLVLLSACNTAAPDGGPYAEGLSGLARAFLQAGARSLLVSHWSVASQPTVQLTTSFVAATREAQGIRQAEALRRAMLRMIEGDDPVLRHPANWAAFVLVGG